MDDSERSHFATRAYYDAFDWPLTPLELHERLIPARRLGLSGAAFQGCPLWQGAPLHDFSRRIEQEKIWVQKWRKMLHKAWWLQAVPYVRGMYASGSLALGNMSPQSDWDVFVVAQAKRLYTARIGILVVAWLVRALRTKHSFATSDTFCFNHWVTTDGLAIRHRSLYTAHGLALLVPVYDPQNYLERLWRTNAWIGGFRPMPTHVEYVRRNVRRSYFLMMIKKILEIFLNTPVGDWLEYRLTTWQQMRIARDPATRAPGGRVTATDHELEFHPHSFEAIALARYNAALVRIGLGAYQERNSGLTK